MAASPGDPAAGALTEVGLIAPAGAGDDGDRLYRPTAAASKWFRHEPGRLHDWRLCYARRAVETVLVDAGNGWPTLRYTFSMRDAAPWVGKPRIAATFPAIAAATNGTVFLDDDTLFLSDAGRIDPHALEATDLNLFLYEFDASFMTPETTAERLERLRRYETEPPPSPPSADRVEPGHRVGR